MSHRFVAYIDEAGDDGIGKFRSVGMPGQSHWLCLSALIVGSDNFGSIVSWRNEITQRMPQRQRKDIHFEDLNHDQRVFACNVISTKQAGIISILSNKTTIIGHQNENQFRAKNHLYKYILRYLIERVTDACRRKCIVEKCPPSPVKLVFSRRGGMDYNDFQDYLIYLKDLQFRNGSRHPIHWDYLDIDAIEAQDHSRLAGLQLADIAASSFHRAVEPNGFGHFETRYAQILRPRVYKSPMGIWLNSGVKPIPSLSEMQLSAEQLEFFKSWREGGQAPGS
jgi:hypothetical protein